MRILHVYHIYPALFGGASTVVYQITKELCKRGHIADVLTTNAYFTGEENREEEVKVYRFALVSQIFSRNNLIVPDMKFISWTKRMVKEYDCIHIHGYRNPYNAFIHHYAMKYGVPYVLQAHGTLPRIMAKKRLKWVYDALFGYRLLRDASKVIALSQMEAEQYRGMGVPDEKIAVIPNGIDLSEYANLPPKGSFKKKFNIDDKEKIVLYLGRIHQSKGLDLLARSFSIVIKELKNVMLVVVGPDEGYTSVFSRLIYSSGMEKKVLLTGFVEKEDKWAALIDSDVFVTPRFHGFPITFLEACLAGCPIVTTSDELYWINNNVGYVVQDSPIMLAKVISNILKDERVRRRFRNNSRYVIRNFGISTVTTQIIDTYESVVNRSVV